MRYPALAGVRDSGARHFWGRISHIRNELFRLGIKTIIPDGRDQSAARKSRGSHGGHSPGMDAHRGRNVIERFGALATQWRGIATHFDKRAITYRAGITLCAILIWERPLGDTP